MPFTRRHILAAPKHEWRINSAHDNDYDQDDGDQSHSIYIEGKELWQVRLHFLGPRRCRCSSIPTRPKGIPCATPVWHVETGSRCCSPRNSFSQRRESRVAGTTTWARLHQRHRIVTWCSSPHHASLHARQLTSGSECAVSAWRGGENANMFCVKTCVFSSNIFHWTGTAGF